MSIRDWQDVVKIVTDSGGEHPDVQLYILMQNLKALSHHPETMGAIADAVRDMGQWYREQADELEREGRARKGGADVLPFNSEGGA